MQELQSKKIIALMSGTSCDSIDAGLCEIMPDLSCKLIEGINFEYPKKVKEKLFDFFAQKATLQEICQMNFVVGKCFADAANILITKWGKPDFISSHGQTVFHYPFNNTLENISLKSTLQIGESSVIAQETDCLTISNFREADIAQGGDGAPLVCFADEQWGKKLMGSNVAIQNIGGIANVTVVSDNSTTFGFDNGVGNIMIDYCCNKFFDMPYDKNGKIAAEGLISQDWLNCLLQDEYYYIPPPKTTGREYFSNNYIEKALKLAPEDPKDIIATLTALTAKSIVDSYQRYVYPVTDIKKVVIGGGGAYNTTMMKFLRNYLPKHIELKTHEDYGISNNFKEVMAFALLGYCSFYAIANNVPSCTGARKKVVLGKITPRGCGKIQKMTVF
jgi:anhydro-N-acetylmuramic acid kinase